MNDSNAIPNPKVNAETRTAVRLPAAPTRRRAFEARLKDLGLVDAKRFLAKDTNDLDWQAREGRFDRIIFPNLDALLGACWDDDVDLPEWLRAGIQIEVMNEPMNGSESVPTAIPNQLAEIAENYGLWRRLRSRKRLIAGVVLSIIALLAMLILFLTLPQG